MRCLAIDDEPLALDIIRKYIQDIPGIELIAVCTNALEAFEIVKNEDIDLIFLDIQMPGLTGIQFLKSLPNPPLVIFTTAYENFALEGYELNAVDYLLKPIPFDRFLKALNKARDICTLSKFKEEKEKSREFIFVRSEYQLIKLNLDDIMYIEGLKDYVKIFTGPKPILSHQNLKTIESKLPDKDFFRIHKSYIISIKHIISVQKSSVNIAGMDIPIGESYKNHFYTIINNLG